MQSRSLYSLIILLFIAQLSFGQDQNNPYNDYNLKDQYKKIMEFKIDAVKVDEYNASIYMYRASNNMFLGTILPIVGGALGAATIVMSPNNYQTGMIMIGAGASLGVFFNIKAGIEFRKASKKLKDANL